MSQAVLKPSEEIELSFIHNYIRDFSVALNIEMITFNRDLRVIGNPTFESDLESSYFVNPSLLEFLKNFKNGGPNEFIASKTGVSYFALALFDTDILIGFTIIGPIYKDLSQTNERYIESDLSYVQFFTEERIDSIINLIITASKSIFLKRESTYQFVFKRECLRNYLTINDRILEAVNFIKENFHRQITLSETAEHVFFSQYYFGKLFKKELGVTFITFLNNERIKNAEKLLINSDLNIFEISKKVGYSQTSYFCKIFKETTTISPTQYRKMHKTKKS